MVFVTAWLIIGLEFSVVWWNCVSLIVLFGCVTIFDGNVMDSMFTFDAPIEPEVLVFLSKLVWDIELERMYLMGGNKYLVFY